MSTFSTTDARSSREAPRVGDYRRGSRLRTTPAGTWFPAIGPADEPAGLLLVHPGVKLSVLEPTVKRLIDLQVPGILPMKPDLVHQAGRNWLVATAAPNPTLAELVDGGAPGKPAHAAAVLSHLAGTLQAVHQAGVAHGLVTAKSVVIGRDGGALLTDWGTAETASRADDLTRWTELARLLAESWCADDDASAAILARAANAAKENGLLAGRDELRGLASGARRDSLAEVVAAMSAQVGRVPKPKTAPEAPRPASRTAADQAYRESQRSQPSRSPVLPRTPAPLRPAAPPAQSGSPTQPPPTSQPATPAPPPQPAAPPPTGPPRVEERSPAGERSPRTWNPRWQFVLAGLTLMALVVAAVNLFILVNRSDSGGVGSSGDGATPSLEIQSVVLQAQQTGSICTLVGLIATNGQPGTVIYRWSGGSLSQPVMSMSAPSGSPQMEIGMLWSAGNSPTGDSLVTLQIIQPQPQSASVMPEPNCR